MPITNLLTHVDTRYILTIETGHWYILPYSRIYCVYTIIGWQEVKEMIRMTATLQKWGNSQALRLTKEVLKAAQFRENEEVEIFADETGIKIQRAQKIETLTDLFKNYNDDYQSMEWNTGAPTGKEVW